MTLNIEFNRQRIILKALNLKKTKKEAAKAMGGFRTNDTPFHGGVFYSEG